MVSRNTPGRGGTRGYRGDMVRGGCDGVLGYVEGMDVIMC